MLPVTKQKIEPDAATSGPVGRTIYFFLLLRVCDKALPAAVLLALLVRPSRNTFDAADAALGLVCLLFIRSPPFYGIIISLWEGNVNTIYGVKYDNLKRWFTTFCGYL